MQSVKWVQRALAEMGLYQRSDGLLGQGTLLALGGVNDDNAADRPHHCPL